ncbi:MAG: carbamate kinase [Clostridiales Family XIII bacterium]|jgi:carbamate kinase|nr:carbamate kinase [Clostridiales Family XIII bacterium]
MEKKQKIVVALGGNALGDNLDEQMKAGKIAAVAIVDLIEAGHELVIVHGNGPQVGMIETAFETASKADEHFPVLPMSVCVALSQGYIGYDLQNVIRAELDARGINKSVSTVITQVEVDEADPAFQDPNKPIGGFMTEAEAKILQNQGVIVKEDSGRGYRRVVASPSPKNIVEKDTILALLNAGQVPIAVGGGGIPVAMQDGQYRGCCAVIDKDRSAALLANQIDADMLIILTAVEKIAINFGTPDQEDLSSMTIAQAHQYIEEEQFAKGSMLPKVEAAISFVQSGTEKKALVTMLSKAKEGIEGKTGTLVL